MAKLPRVGDMQLDEDLHYQRWEWRLQRLGWVVMLLLVLAALAGLLGRGLLSRTSVTTPDGSLHVEYHRFLHYHDPAKLDIWIKSEPDKNSELRLTLDEEYLANLQIERIDPEPLRVETGGGSQTFVFRVAGGQASIRVVIHFRADGLYSLTGRIGLLDRDPLVISQFVYP